MTTKTKKVVEPKLTWRREGTDWAAYYGVPGKEILLVVYQRGAGHWWFLTSDLEIRKRCDAFFLKKCESQWGLDTLKVRLLRVLDHKFEELRKDRPWFNYLVQREQHDQA
jgi:hypothetical protein